MVTRTITRVDPTQYGKFMGTMCGAIYLIFGALFGLFILLGSMISGNIGIILMGLVMAIIIAVSMGAGGAVAGLLMGVIGGSIYNFVAGKIGGIRLDLE